MKETKYYLDICGKDADTAAVKAPADMCYIMQKRGYLPIAYLSAESISRTRNRLHSLQNWGKIFFLVDRHGVLVIQYPYKLNRIASLLLGAIIKLRKTHVIMIAHDIDSIRGINAASTNRYRERLLKKSNQIICHNAVMKKWMVEHGYSSENIIPLGLFDYIFDGKYLEHPDRSSVIIAGNLNSRKSPYISKYIELKRNYQVNLFGPNFVKPENADNFTYFGSFPPEELPCHLQGAFGLVWDGDSVDTCNGLTGEYLRYNNPHKASLYIASGIPVIIWKEAALAKYITENGLGFTVSSLNEIEDKLGSISQNDYEIMCNNVKAEGEKLRKGYFLNRALDEIEERYKSSNS